MADKNPFGPHVKTTAYEQLDPDQESGGRTLTHMPALQAPAPRRRAEPQATQAMAIQAKRELPLFAQAQEPPEINLTRHALEPSAPHDGRLILHHDPDSECAARFRILRHHLMEQGRPQVVVVSSPRPGEGKTTCAINLALALAECGRARVLLVEATVRRPQLAAVFRFVPPWCFAEQLATHRHQPFLPWGFVDIPDMWLHVAAINPRVAQSQLLDAPAFAIAMERLRLADYDHIVIDAPAVLGSAEVNLIQDAADGVLLTCLARRTTARMLRTAVEQLQPTKIMGTVLLEGLPAPPGRPRARSKRAAFPDAAPPAAPELPARTAAPGKARPATPGKARPAAPGSGPR